jgi:hypothetical protein
MNKQGRGSPGRMVRLSTLRLLLLGIVVGFCISFGGGWVLAAQTGGIGSPGEPPVAPLAAGSAHDQPTPPLMRSRPLQGDQIHQIYLCGASPQAAPFQDAARADPTGLSWTCAPARDTS